MIVALLNIRVLVHAISCARWRQGTRFKQNWLWVLILILRNLRNLLKILMFKLTLFQIFFKRIMNLFLFLNICIYLSLDLCLFIYFFFLLSLLLRLFLIFSLSLKFIQSSIFSLLIQNLLCFFLILSRLHRIQWHLTLNLFLNLLRIFRVNYGLFLILY